MSRDRLAVVRPRSIVGKCANGTEPLNVRKGRDECIQSLQKRHNGACRGRTTRDSRTYGEPLRPCAALQKRHNGACRGRTTRDSRTYGEPLRPCAALQKRHNGACRGWTTGDSRTYGEPLRPCAAL